MFRIKICGITNVSDAVAAASAGADAVGLNFFASSPRQVTMAVARQIVAALPEGVCKVGLFVDAPLEQIVQTAADLALDLIQLHGSEPPEMVARLAPRPVIRAFRLEQRGLKPVYEYLEECRRLGTLPRMVLLDAYVPGVPGGTGQTTDWTRAAEYTADGGYPPLVLAGGLTPYNIAEAIRSVRPAAVDTASGVERSPGQKDSRLMAAFVQAARAAFELVGGMS